MTGHRPHGRAPLLFLAPDTGGGHLERGAGRYGRGSSSSYPGQFAPILCDPLIGPDSPWVVRHVTGQYGALTRRAPWAWGALYRVGFCTRSACSPADVLFRYRRGH